jgi:hypothetical protein
VYLLSEGVNLLLSRFAFLLCPDRPGASLRACSFSFALHLVQQVSIVVECSGKIGMRRSKRALKQRQARW